MSECILRDWAIDFNQLMGLFGNVQKLLALLTGSPDTSIFMNKTCIKGEYLWHCFDLSVGVAIIK